MLLPRLIIERFCDLDFESLSRQGIAHLILDVDNTIARHGVCSLEPGVAERLRGWRETGVLRGACILSNVMYGRAAFERVAQFGQELGIPHISTGFVHRKPKPRYFHEAMRLMGSEPASTAIIGDQMFTDILGGNRLGLFTILVKPLGPDHWTTALTMRRWREKAVLRRAGLGWRPDL
jgi:HAD superfamily phosphatase (TIGR01668 family)